MSEKIEVVKIDTEPAKKSLADLRKELKSVRDEMVSLDSDSEAFLKAAHKAGELQHQIQEIGEAVRGASSDFGDMVGNVAKVGAGITGAFQMANAALDLFGVESEEVTKSIKKMQDMMAMTQGLSAIDASIKSINKLRNAITSTTTSAKILRTVLQPKIFLAITAAITALTLIWDKFGKKIKESIPFLQSIEDGWKKITSSSEDALKAQKKYNDELAAAHNKVEELVLQRKISKLNSEAAKQYRDLASQLEIAQAKLVEIVKEQEKHKDNYTEWRALEDEGEEVAKIILDLKHAMDALLKSEDSYVEKTKEKKEVKQKEVDKIQEQINLEYQLLELRKTEDRQYGASKQALEDYLSIQQKELQHLEDLGKVGTVEYVRLQTAIANTKNEITDFGKETKKALNPLEEALKKIELVELGLDLQFKQGTLDEKDYLEQIITNEEAKLSLLKEGTEEWYKQALAVEEYKKQLAEVDIDRIATGLQRVQQIGNIAFGALADSLNAFADMQDTTTKEGFEKQKKMQIAAVTMNMLNGVMSAWVSAMNPANAWMTIWGQIAAGAAQTIATLSMGAAQIKKIKQTTFDGGGSTAGTSANMSSAGASVVAPVQYTKDVQGSSIEGAIRDTKVYVTESDISSTQQRVNVAESESRY